MFYLKHNGEKVFIECDNVYNTCPRCGKEVRVNIQDVLSDGVSDLYGTAVYCQDCAKKVKPDEYVVCPARSC